MQNSEKIKPEKNLTQLADQLDQIQSKENEGRGVTCVRDIVHHLRQENIEDAKAICWNEYDKIRNYPDIQEFLINNLFKPEEQTPWVWEKFQ